MQVDLTDVEAWTGGGGLPPGTYDVSIEEATEGTSSGGYGQFELLLTCPQGRMRDWLVIVPKTLGKLRALIEAAGLSVPSGEFDFDPSELVGKLVQIDVAEETYDGKARARVQGYRPSAKQRGAAGKTSSGDTSSTKSAATEEDIRF